MLDMNEVLTARAKHHEQHGAYPTEVRANPKFAYEVFNSFPSVPLTVDFAEIRSRLFGPGFIGLDWYVDDSVSEQERFRLA